MKLSVCLIAKNESNLLPGCLESVKSVADEIILVDTGSTDDTPEIARRFGAKVFTFEWCNDFSAARNYSISQAQGDWILWLDSDERLTPESQQVIKDLLQPHKKAVAYEVLIRNRIEGGSYYTLSHAHRLFSNHRGIRFTGVIHEQIAPSIKLLRGELLPSPLVLEHLGYDSQEVDQQAKARRNEQLLHKALRKSPNNGYVHFTLGQHYLLNQNPQNAAKHLELAERSGQLPRQMLVSLYNSLAEARWKMGRLRSAAAAVQKSLQIQPRQVAAYFMKYRLALEENNYETALHALEQLRKYNDLNRSKSLISVDVNIPPIRVIRAIVDVLKQANRREEAVRYLLESLKEEPEERWPRVAGEMRAIGHGLPLADLIARNSTPETIAKLAVAVIRIEDFPLAAALYEKLVDQDEYRELALKRLVGLYAKMGQAHKAEYFLRELNCLHPNLASG